MEASCAEAALVRDVLAGIRPYDVLDEGGIARLVGASSVRRLAAHEVLLRWLRKKGAALFAAL